MIFLPLLLLISHLSMFFSYNTYISKRSVDLSQAAYCVDTVEDWTCVTCDKDIKLEYIVEQSDAKALQGFDYVTNTIFTSFRGSHNLHNWLDNIQVSKISPYNNSDIKVEKGFFKEYSFIKEKLIDNLQKLSKKYSENKLLITGHSAGASLATLMAYDIIKDFPEFKLEYLYHFGSPRVGNSEFSNDFNSYNISSFRVTHYYDIVPHVPEEFLGYKHIQNEIWYNKDNSNYKICNDDNTEDKQCSNSCSPTHCTSFDDHLYYLNVSMGTDKKEYCY